MCASEKTDLIVKYYDLASGISGETEVGWYLSKEETFGGPDLDLVCGTGRLAILLAQKGLEVTAIDSSQRMLTLSKVRTTFKASSPAATLGKRLPKS